MLQSKLPEFDELLKLAENNPEELEKLRRTLVDQVIQQAPERLRRRLQGLQFQIESQCKIAGSPMAACIKISEMMHESFAQLRYALNDHLVQSSSTESLGQALVESEQLKPAQILSFPSRQAH